LHTLQTSAQVAAETAENLMNSSQESSGVTSSVIDLTEQLKQFAGLSRSSDSSKVA
jgi:hypothetical protein